MLFSSQTPGMHVHNDGEGSQKKVFQHFLLFISLYSDQLIGWKTPHKSPNYLSPDVVFECDVFLRYSKTSHSFFSIACHRKLKHWKTFLDRSGRMEKRVEKSNFRLIFSAREVHTKTNCGNAWKMKEVYFLMLLICCICLNVKCIHVRCRCCCCCLFHCGNLFSDYDSNR